MQSKSKKTRETMYPVVRQFIATDLNQREFCEANQLEYHQFQYWLRKYRQEVHSQDEPSFSSIEIELPATKRHIVIRTKSGVEIEIPL